MGGGAGPRSRQGAAGGLDWADSRGLGAAGGLGVGSLESVGVQSPVRVCCWVSGARRTFSPLRTHSNPRRTAGPAALPSQPHGRASAVLSRPMMRCAFKAQDATRLFHGCPQALERVELSLRSRALQVGSPLVAICSRMAMNDC